MDSYQKRITLKDVARKAKLSVASVSMALRDSPLMAKVTVERVKRLAESMGYKPDPALSALAAHRNRLRVQSGFSVIGLITNWNTADGWSGSASSQEVIQGAEKRALQLGFSLQTFWAREKEVTPSRFNQILQSRGIRGIVLAPFENNDDTLDLEWSRYSVVTISRPSRYTLFHHIIQNPYMDLLRCWEKLAERGYRKVGLVVQGEIANRWSHQWEAAHSYARSQLALSQEIVPTLNVFRPNEVEAIRKWLREYKPDAVISRCDRFHDAAEAEGLDTPEKLGYVSLNANADREGVSGIYHRRDVLGAMAIDILNGQLLRNNLGPQETSIGTQVDGIWQEGNTLLDLSKAPRKRKRTAQ